MREIAARAIYRYDEIWIKKLNDALGVHLELSGNLNDFRKQFELRSGLVDYEEDELSTNHEEEAEEDFDKVPTSKILDPNPVFSIFSFPPPRITLKSHILRHCTNPN